MSNPLKVRLRSGEAEIEIEGSRGDIDQLLELWWPPARTNAPFGSNSKNPPKVKRPSKPTAKSASSSEPAEATLDVNAIANLVKESEHFSAIENKILHAPGQRYNKLAFAIWFVDQPLTSGDIHRLLSALGVRIDLSAVSVGLKTNLKKLTTDKARKKGGAPAAYQLTSKARSDFEKWLLADADED